jgi:hypothetical protein
MRFSFVLRLEPEPLRNGELEGEVEAVASGQAVRFRGARDLIDACRTKLVAAPLQTSQPVHSDRGERGP